jgi:hypothetical protein
VGRRSRSRRSRRRKVYGRRRRRKEEIKVNALEEGERRARDM